MATYAIDCGHTMSGADYGAVGIKAESNLTREVGKRVINKLKAMGNTVIDCTLDSCSSLGQSLGYRVNKSNNYNVDLFVSIHFNCFNSNAHGTEVHTYGGRSFIEANRVLSNLASLGFTNRGIKDGSSLYVLRHTKAKAMLVEVCFCDSRTDMGIYNAERCANAIVEGIIGKKVDTPKPQIQKEEYDMDKVVTYYGDVDVFSAVILSQKLGCAVIKEKDLKNVKAKEIIKVGGSKGDLTGNNRFETFKSVAKKI